MVNEEIRQRFYQESISNPEEFWSKSANKLHWYKNWTQILDVSSSPLRKWFVGGELNVCYNLLDRHVDEGRGGSVAFYYESALTKEKKMYTYNELQYEVSHIGSILVNLGITKGSVVMIYLPRMSETMVTILACQRIGAIYCCIYPGFFAEGLIRYLEHAQPVVVVSTTMGLVKGLDRIHNLKEQLDKALMEAKFQPKACLIIKRPGLDCHKMEPGRDYYWDELLKSATPTSCVPVEANDPMSIVYTSGTTREAKGVVIMAHILAMMVARNELELDIDGQDVVYHSQLEFNWVACQQFQIFRPMIAGHSSLLVEGDPPFISQFEVLRVIEEYKVTFMLRGVRNTIEMKENISKMSVLPEYTYNSLKHVELSGEALGVDLMEWVSSYFDCQVSNHYGQTESGVGIGFSSSPLSHKDGSLAFVGAKMMSTLGFQVRVVNEDGSDAEHGQRGTLLIRLPLPPGAISTLWRNELLFVKEYFSEFPGYYNTKDEAIMFKDGSFKVTGRSDDVILVSAIRFKPSALEEVILSHPSVTECFVGPVPSSAFGNTPFALYTTTGKEEDEMKVNEEISSLVLRTFGEIVRFRGALQVSKLPKTITGKTNRKLLHDIMQSKPNTKISASSSALRNLLKEDI